MSHLRFFHKTTIFLLFFCLSWGCNLNMPQDNNLTHSSKHETVSKIYLEKGKINCVAGDLIFRRGSSFASHLVLSCDPNSIYSHVGIIYKTHDTTFVIHAVPGENAPNTPEYVKCEPLEEFLTQDKTTDYGFCHIKSDYRQTAELAAQKAYSFYKSHCIFDHEFNLQNNQALYCTELVWKAYQMAGLNLIKPADINALPLSDSQIIYPSTIFNSMFFDHIYP